MLTPPPCRSEVTKLSEDVAALKAHAQHARSADGVEDRLRSLAETVQNLPTSLSRDATSDAVKQLSETVLGELRRRDAAPVAARPDVDEKLALRFERLERALENAVAQRPARAPDDGALERRLGAVDAALDAVKRDVADAVGKQRDAADALARSVDAQLRDVRKSVDDGRAESARLLEATTAKLSEELRAHKSTSGDARASMALELKAIHDAVGALKETVRSASVEAPLRALESQINTQTSTLRETIERERDATRESTRDLVREELRGLRAKTSDLREAVDGGVVSSAAACVPASSSRRASEK